MVSLAYVSTLQMIGVSDFVVNGYHFPVQLLLICVFASEDSFVHVAIYPLKIQHTHELLAALESSV